MTITPGVKKIAVLRALALGDYMVALPALDALRAAYPHAEIVLLGTPLIQSIVANHPSPVNRVVVVPISNGVRVENGTPENPQELEAFFGQMQAEQFDIAIQLHGGGKHTNPFVKRLGAKLTVGLKTPEAPPLDRWVQYAIYQPEVLRLLEVMSLVGAHTCQLDPALTVTEADRAAAQPFIDQLTKPYVVVHPGASDIRRRWPADCFGMVADVLTREKDVQIVITGTDSERDVVDRMIESMRTQPVDLCGKLSFGALVGLLEQAKAVITNDTGPNHVARAVGTPTVGIYWGPNLINWGPLSRAKNRVILSWTVKCPLCGFVCPTDYPFNRHNDCDHLTSFVADANPEAVLDAARELV
ncbi:MAG: glycosyltransferase family 9 protein [Anaerolineae bacterium]|nr:glycosyltransferase family 9 protein [Anaerolineae bacterium]